MKSRLLPLVKRFGWIVGLVTWFNCRHGHHRRYIIESYPPDVAGWSADGYYHSSGRVKVACKDCECVELTRIIVTANQTDIVEAHLEDGTKINLLT